MLHQLQILTEFSIRMYIEIDSTPGDKRIQPNERNAKIMSKIGASNSCRFD
eukprot:COSAG02_NODE_146_length_33985_cov_263.461695_12_plen_51_part_00